MNITFHSIASQSVSLFKEKIVPVFTNQRERIAVVVAFALGCLVLCYYVFKCFKAKSVELQGNYPVKTWDLRMDSTHKRSSQLPEGYEWVKGKVNAQTFMEKAQGNQDVITQVTRFAYARIPPRVNPNSVVYIGDLIIYAQTLAQIQAILTAVVDSKKYLRAIFSTLFLHMPNDTASVTDKLQKVVSCLSREQLMNVLTLDNSRGDYFYQEEQCEIGKIEVHNYLQYQQIFEQRPEFIEKCREISQYAEYVKAKATEEANKKAVFVEDCWED